ncbi:hypothetical protein NSED_03970 [Candidatus Nitrosopumilus sediminis]|uniref:Uncharacterized protein n=2 Tax=Candidatus Nitrosopumilus sediminis TaxID=1229909 RepID=K0BC50_9ARCH|nr:hypothetical protein NSED_03970 [Candidatus Nitrosopumilus sediminis]
MGTKMKTRFLIITVFIIALIPVTAKSFAEGSFNGHSSIDPPLSEVIAGQSTEMNIRFSYTTGPYALNNFTPIIEVNPSSAKQFVKVEVDSLEITQGQIKRIPVTLTVDSHTEHEKIFLSISYDGYHFQSGELYKSSWNDQVALDVKGALVPEPKSSKPISQNCGPGTVLQDGICVEEQTSQPNSDGIWGGVTEIPSKISPLKQSKSGIPFDKIQCNVDLILIQKHDGSPACVTESTKQKLIERGWTAKDDSILKTSTNCMTLEQSKETAPFFKTPAYLPDGYSYVCSQSGTPSESYIVYHHQEIQDWDIPELISDGAIFIYQIDERNIVSAEKLETLGTAEQRTQDDYDSVMEVNPSLQPQLIRINGMLAYAVDSCPVCGMQTANFPDGTFIQKSTSTETKIKFIDENGVNYMLKTTLPLDELILVAESLQ